MRKLFIFRYLKNKDKTLENLRAISTNTKTKIFFKLDLDSKAHKCYLCSQKKAYYTSINHFGSVSFCSDCINKNFV